MKIIKKILNCFIILSLLVQVLPVNLSSEEIKGKVVGISGKNKAWIDIGSEFGLKEGVELEVSRKRKIIAKVKVISTKENFSEVEIIELVEGEMIDLGDIVKNISVAPPPIKQEIEKPTQEIEEKKDTIPTPQIEIKEKETAETPEIKEIEDKKIEKKIQEKIVKQPPIIEEVKKQEKEIKIRDEDKRQILKNFFKREDETKKLSSSKQKKKKLFLKIAGGIIALTGLFILSANKSSDKKSPFGTIEISSFPPGAKIYLNNNDTGKITPDTLVNIPSGWHTITLSLKSPIEYRNWSKTVNVEGGKTVVIPETEAILEADPNSTPGSVPGW